MYEIGTKIHVEITGYPVKEERTGTDSTTRVSEMKRPDGTFGYPVHFLYLNSPYVTRDKDGTVKASFDAEVTGKYQDSDLLTTRVIEKNPGGYSYTHFVYLNAKSVTRLPEAPPKPGQSFKVKFTGTVGRDDGPQATTLVKDEGGFEHYLYLYDIKVFGEPRPSNGDTVTVEFDAVIPLVSTPYTARMQGKTEVTNPVSGLRHYLDLRSPYVTGPAAKPETEDVLAQASLEWDPAEKQQEEGDGEMPYKADDLIRVKFSGTVVENSPIGYPLEGPAATVLVREDNGLYHYLFPRDVNVFPEGRPSPGAKVSVNFTAKVSDENVFATASKGPLGTRRVRSTSGDNEDGYYSFAFLRSTSVSQEEKPAERILPSRTEVTSTKVIARITELKEAAGDIFIIKRTKTGMRLGSEKFASPADALKYLDDQDYIVGRFTVDIGESKLSPADNDELLKLVSLDLAGQSEFAERWTDGITLRNSSYYSASWARNQAVSELGISDYRFDNWPLNLIDWDEAASEILETFEPVEFGPSTFYAGPE